MAGCPGLWPADGGVRPAVPVPGQTQHVQMAAHEAAAQAGTAAAAATTRPVVLRHAGAVLAMTPAFDTSVPNMARVYNYWLGGKDHFAADRAEAERLVALYPPLPALARENRAFLIKAVGWAARQGIGQFIDPAAAGMRHPRRSRALPRPGRRLRGDRRIRLADGAGQLPGPLLCPVRG